MLAIKTAAQYFRHLRGEIVSKRSLLADIELQHRGPSAEAFDLRDQGLGLVCLAVVGADDVDALGGQMQRGVFAEAAAGAGDQCDFSGSWDVPQSSG